jgi:hypothetical protein
MRALINKYSGECRKCGKTLEVGSNVVYEKHVGIFCPPCAPTDAEEIRAYRQAAADKRADKYEEWAGKREAKAEALYKPTERYNGDTAFWTQPGRIIARERVFSAREKSFEETKTAERFRSKADSLRHVVVKGDAAKADEARRVIVRGWIKPGMMVDTCHCGILKVLKVNKKTATIEGRHGNFTHDLMYLNPIS